MAETGKSLRHMLLGTLESITVTRAELDGPDGISLDAELLEAAGFLEHEKVELLDVTNGSRLSAPVRGAARGSGEMAASGAVAQLVRPGDVVTLSAFGWMKEKQAKKHAPLVVRVDAQNRPSRPATPVPEKPAKKKKTRAAD
ncbi:MAG: aspartate 1-decarboxylase [Myxococcales bacterium]|nr:aspartate 1-decarboxylase [Myxococcales bacterium]